MLTWIIFAIATCLIIKLFSTIWWGQNSGKKLPPGPRFGLPFLGHLLYLGARPHQTLHEWTKYYGPIIRIQLGVYNVVVINNGKLIKRAFSSSALAGRPRIKILDDYSDRKGIAFLDGHHAFEQRRFVMSGLKDLMKNGESMEQQILRQTDDLLENLRCRKGTPLSVSNLFYRNVINSLLSVYVSKQFPHGDSRFDKLEDTLKRAAHNNGLLAVTGFYVPKLCDLFPSLVGYNLWQRLKSEVRGFFHECAEEHRETFVTGSPRDLMDAYLQKIAEATDPSSSFYYGVHLLDTFKDLFTAGMDTTSNQLEWLIHYMVKYPNVQAKMCDEIQSVLGSEQPALSDRSRLPYTEAVIQEALRISNVGPFGVLHSALEDFEFEGYLIPKGTIVVGNLYAASYDPALWKDPHIFKPERFIDENGNSKSSTDLLSFGTGKRACIGEAFARNQLFLFTVKIFQEFCVEAVGNVPYDHRLSLVVAPPEFKVAFHSRNTLAHNEC